MNDYLLKAYHIARVVIPAGAGWTGITWGYKRWQKFQDDIVLATFRYTDPAGEWHSANGVMGELGIKAASP